MIFGCLLQNRPRKLGKHSTLRPSRSVSCVEGGSHLTGSNQMAMKSLVTDDSGMQVPTFVGGFPACVVQKRKHDKCTYINKYKICISTYMYI